MNVRGRRSQRGVLGRTATAVLLTASLAACASVGPPRPEARYQAEVVVEVVGPTEGDFQRQRFLEFYSEGKRRRETRGNAPRVVSIDRPDLRVTWVLSPEARTFEEHRISALSAIAVPNPFGPRVEADFDPVGSDELEGVALEKFEVSGDSISGEAWLTQDFIPFRFKGTIERQGERLQVEVRYASIERGSQAAYLFSIPPSYAGYENRKQERGNSQQAIDDAASALRDSRRGLPGDSIPLPPPPLPPPPPPPMAY